MPCVTTALSAEDARLWITASEALKTWMGQRGIHPQPVTPEMFERVKRTYPFCLQTEARVMPQKDGRLVAVSRIVGRAGAGAPPGIHPFAWATWKRFKRDTVVLSKECRRIKLASVRQRGISANQERAKVLQQKVLAKLGPPPWNAKLANLVRKLASELEVTPQRIRQILAKIIWNAEIEKS